MINILTAVEGSEQIPFNGFVEGQPIDWADSPEELPHIDWTDSTWVTLLAATREESNPFQTSERHRNATLQLITTIIVDQSLRS